MKFIRNLFRKKEVFYNNFKSAGYNEMILTPYHKLSHVETPVFWTPIFQKKKAPTELIDYLLDSSFYNDTDIFTHNGKEEKINQMIEAFIDSAFEDDELFIPQNEESESSEIPDVFFI
jgi:hypothetical protein